MMDNDKAKLFVGGISRETSEDALRAHFGKYGTVLGSLVAKDKNTKIPRGFGFVWFSDPIFADKALQDSHVILGRTVEVKKAIPKSEQLQFQQQQQQQISNHDKNSGFSENSSTGNGNNYFRTKKVFVGGLSSSLTEEQFKNYFERFGVIVDVVVMQDSSTNRPRGFGFVTFDSEESVDKVMLNTFHELNGRLVEVKRAVPKEGVDGSSSRYITKSGIRGSSSKSAQPGNYLPYGPGYEIIPGYVPLPGYSSVGAYQYGVGIYGGYPTVGYGGPGFGVAPFAPRNPWNGPVMVGATMFPSPYNNGFVYPVHMNGGVSFMGTMMGGHSGIVGSNGNGKLTEVSGSNGHLLPEVIVPPIEIIRSGVDSSTLNDSNAGGSS